MKPKRILLVVVVLIVLLLVVPGVHAKVRTDGGGDMPFYARIAADEIFHTDDWAAIVFYRPPGCVPVGFNLLEFYDFDAFGCRPPTTDGFIIWEAEPWLSAPIQIKLHGLGAVPVWFVRWPELQGAVKDGVLTISELEEMQSLLIGSAGFYKETLHPTGGAQVPMIQFVAHGMLQDGRSFKVHATLASVGATNVHITFR
ncbi:MAG: hypothetical protein U9R25_09510 [Chloroflexota bacterium]|nr:hypothetical protein [Chloroflexota bacterium]